MWAKATECDNVWQGNGVWQCVARQRSVAMCGNVRPYEDVLGLPALPRQGPPISTPALCKKEVARVQHDACCVVCGCVRAHFVTCHTAGTLVQALEQGLQTLDHMRLHVYTHNYEDRKTHMCHVHACTTTLQAQYRKGRNLMAQHLFSDQPSSAPR